MSPPIPFVPFRRFAPVRFYQSNRIPHWRQDECTYFVTFRLGDALPEAICKKIEGERNQWLADRGGAFERLSEPQIQEYERRFGGLLDESLDRGSGSCALKIPELRAVIQEAIAYLDKSKARMGDFVIMPNHVHALMTPLEGFKLEETLQSLKGFTARAINRISGKAGSLWQRDSYDRIVRDGAELAHFQDYIANNPVTARLDEHAFTHVRAVYEW
ncbi:MAG: transposase [Verrucomicrobiales bacterium]|nr:transposase [Verrucomicrobiales bacterium]